KLKSPQTPRLRRGQSSRRFARCSLSVRLSFLLHLRNTLTTNPNTARWPPKRVRSLRNLTECFTKLPMGLSDVSTSRSRVKRRRQAQPNKRCDDIAPKEFATRIRKHGSESVNM